MNGCNLTLVLLAFNFLRGRPIVVNSWPLGRPLFFIIGGIEIPEGRSSSQ